MGLSALKKNVALIYCDLYLNFVFFERLLNSNTKAFGKKI